MPGASDRPRVTLLTALPMVWGEGDAADVLAGRTAKSETLSAIEQRVDIQPIDIISQATLGRNVAIIAQPRRLTPSELVVLDNWVRAGGRAMIFADPELVWPSRYAPGDNRRAPPVTLLDPLFAHWGVALGDSDHEIRTVRIDGYSVALASAGTWTGPKSCVGAETAVLDCAIGKGRVVFVGDADVLDARLWHAQSAENPKWLAHRVLGLAGVSSAQSTLVPRLAVAGVAIALIVTLAALYRKKLRT